MDIPLDEVVYFDAITSHPTTMAATDADSTPTFEVFEESTDTDIGVGGNLTKRTSKTGNYRGSFTASAANGFEVGKWYNVIGSATVNSIAGKGVLMRFRLILAESVVGANRVDTRYVSGTTQTAGDLSAQIDTVDNFVDTELAAVQTDVTTLLSRLGTPSNLGGGATVAANLSDIESQTDDIGVAGAGLTAVPGLHKVVTGTIAASPSPTTTVFGTDLTAADNVYNDQAIEFTSGALLGQSKTILGYANTLGLTTVDEAFTSAPSAGDTFKVIASHTHTTTAIGTAVWATATRTLTALDEDSTTLDLDATIRAAMGLASANLDTQISGLDSKLDTIDNFIDTEVAAILAAVDTEVGAIKSVTDKLDTAMELDVAVYRFTTNALEQAPSGGGGSTDWTADERTAIRTILGIPASGTTPDVPSAGALKVIDDLIDTEIGTITSNVAAILADTNELQADWADGGRLDLILDARASQTSVNTLAGYVDTEVAAILAAVDTEIAAIQASLGSLFTTARPESYRSAGATGTIDQLLYEINQHLGESSIAGVTKTMKRIDGSATAKTYTLNDSVTPTAITETT